MHLKPMRSTVIINGSLLKATPFHQAIHFVLKPAMSFAPAKPWMSLLAAGGMVISASLIATPANAAPCVTTLVSQIVIATTYQCELGTLQYKFNDTIAELSQDSPTATISFNEVSQNSQNVIFSNLESKSFTFYYEVSSPLQNNETIDTAELTFTQIPSTPLPDPNFTGVFPFPNLPSNPYDSPLTFSLEFAPDTNFPSPYPTLTSMTSNIYKTPAPLPLASAGLAFAFSRKLRRRINQVSVKRLSI